MQRLTHQCTWLFAIIFFVVPATWGYDDHEALLKAALGYRSGALERFRQDLLEMASMPTISSLPEHQPDIDACAEWLKAKLQKIGMEDVRIIYPEGGPRPTVYAASAAAGPGAPTVLIYAHYDVQPADPLELWDSPPFEPRVADGKFWGRGVDDDKGGLLNALHAVESYLQSNRGGGGGGLPVNIKMLLEGEEEIGSPHMPALLGAVAPLLSDVDVALSADGGQISETQPGIATGFRGAVALQVDITTAKTDLHSGAMGGSVQNAAHALVHLLASLRDPATGKVSVEGFYVGVVEPTDEDRADMEKHPLDTDDERSTLGVGGYLGEEGRTTLERRWYRPTLEVVGLGSGFQGEGIKTIVPATATAKLAARLVPDQEPGDVADKIRAHLQKHAPPFSNVTVKALGFRADPWTSPRDTPANQAAARVLKKLIGADPLYTKSGGTVAAFAYLQRYASVPTTVFSFCLGDHIHAPNERLKVSQFDLGSEGWILMLHELGVTGKGALADAKAALSGRGGAAQDAAAAGRGVGAHEEL